MTNVALNGYAQAIVAYSGAIIAPFARDSPD